MDAHRKAKSGDYFTPLYITSCSMCYIGLIPRLPRDANGWPHVHILTQDVLNIAYGCGSLTVMIYDKETIPNVNCLFVDINALLMSLVGQPTYVFLKLRVTATSLTPRQRETTTEPVDE